MPLDLAFATNFFGIIKPDIKKRLEKLIKNPNQKNWDDTYSLIINVSGHPKTLWQAVLMVDADFPRRKALDEPWTSIPSQETLIKAIRLAVFQESKIMN